MYSPHLVHLFTGVLVYQLHSGMTLVVSNECLGCLCEGLNGCEDNSGCDRGDDACGPYKITQAQWRAAGLELTGSELGDYSACSKRLHCSDRFISLYLEKIYSDCNGDGRVDCNELARVLFYGSGCQQNKDNTWTRYEECHSLFSPRDSLAPPSLTLRYLEPSNSTDSADKCLKCLCKAQTGCIDKGCMPNKDVGEICGPFYISRPMFKDARVPGMDPNSDRDFKRCAKDLECSQRSLVSYHKRFKKLCTVRTTSNPCEPYYRMHIMGPGPCQEKEIKLSWLWKKFEEC